MSFWSSQSNTTVHLLQAGQVPHGVLGDPAAVAEHTHEVRLVCDPLGTGDLVVHQLPAVSKGFRGLLHLHCENHACLSATSGDDLVYGRVNLLRGKRLLQHGRGALDLLVELFEPGGDGTAGDVE